MHRRFESHGDGGGVRVYDDYAHHPTEIAASLTAARQALAGAGRLIAVFQPGTYSRTQTFAREFADAMAHRRHRRRHGHLPGPRGTDPGRHRRDDQRPRSTCRPEQVVYEPRYDAVPERIAALARPGDLVVTMGIGNVYLLCDEIRDACARAAGGVVMTATTTYLPVGRDERRRRAAAAPTAGGASR